MTLQEFEDIGGKATDALAGELWEVKKERIKQASKFGGLPGWDLRSVRKESAFFFFEVVASLFSRDIEGNFILQVIVKSGDDCRQEHLAVQLISHFYG